jgi:V/A-type H+-transporting ATPase subunit E
MNGIDKITEKIKNDALEEAGVIIDAAKADAQKTIDKFKADAAAEKDKIGRQTELRKLEIVKHQDDMAHLEGRKQLLSAKQSVLDDVFKEAFKTIRKLEKAEYIDFLSGMAFKTSLNGIDEIILSAADRESYGADIVAKANRLLESSGKNASLVLSDEVRDIDGGLILRTGNIETNCTFDVLYDIARGELTTEVAGILF